MPPSDFSPAADRNKQPILQALLQLLPEQGSALEIASGTGQHAAWFAAGLPHWSWQPSDAQSAVLPDIAGRIAQEALTNVRAPLLLDVMTERWLLEPEQFDLVFCANMLHIARWPTCAALMHGSARHLAPGGVVVTYGPYLEDSVSVSPGNQEFDRSLRQQNPAWGLRRREDVELAADQAGLQLSARVAMPANNLLLAWRRKSL